MTIVNVNSPRAQDPNLIDTTVEPIIRLTPHQCGMLHQCKVIETEQDSEEFKYLILSSSPGAGKSFTILAHILDEKMREGFTNNTIIVPGNLFDQWSDYIKLFNSSLRVLYIADVSHLIAVRYNLDTIMDYDIILISTVMYPNLASELINRQWGLHRVIFDEVDSVDNMVTEPYPASYTWFVSASFSPEKIGTYSEIFPYSKIESLTCDCDQSFIDTCFKVKDKFELIYPCLDTDIDRAWIIEKEYNRAVPNDDTLEFAVIQKNMNVGKFSNVMKYGSGENEIAIKLEYITDKATDAISYFKNYSKNLLITLRELLNTRTSLNESIKKLSTSRAMPRNRMVRGSAPDNTEKELAELTKQLTEIDTSIINTKCKLAVVLNNMNGLEYRADCCGYLIPDPEIMTIKQGHDHKCIICDSPFKYSSVEALMNYDPVYVDSGHMSSIDTFDKIPKNMTKLNTLKYIIHVANKKHGCKNLKMIVFCDNSTIFRDIEAIGKAAGNNVGILDNQDVKVVTKVIEDFGNGTTNLILIESQLYGAGLNLECCTDMVLFHTISNETQAIGRAQRLGRTTNLLVHKLYYQNEISYE